MAPAANHRGALAGLSAQEREHLVQEQLLAAFNPDQIDYNELYLSELAQVGEPRGALQGMLEALTRDELYSQARNYGLKGLSKLRKAELVEAVANEVASNETDLFMAATHCDDLSYTALRRLADEGGCLTLGPGQTRDATPMSPMPPYVCLYSTFEGFTFLIPEELRPLVAGLDWDEVERVRSLRADAVSLVESLVDRCGIVSVRDAHERYNAWYGRDMAIEEFVHHVLGAIHELDPMYGYWEYDDVSYLVNFDLDEAEISPDDVDGAQDLENFKRFLVRKHHERPVAPFPEEMRGKTAFEALCALPSAQKLLGFFDAHVPDGDNDYAYADRMIESIADLNANLVSFEHTVGDLDEADLCLSDEERAQMLPLLRAFLDDVPYWENNGWSNNQVRALEGTRVFYGPDGSLLKVGRNDPCPCGSGKKYKRCCGA